MKKNLFIVACTMIPVFLIFGCGSSSAKTDTTQPGTELSKDDADSALLKEAVNEMNQGFPVTENGTRIDSAVVLSKKVIQIDYTFTNLAKDEIDTTNLSQQLDITKMKSGFKTLDSLVGNIVLDFYYRDKKGAFVYEIKTNTGE